MEKICNICNLPKLIDEFYNNRAKCKACFILHKTQYYKNNDRTETQKNYRDNNKSKIKQYRIDNKDKRKQWEIENKKSIRIYMNKYFKERALDPEYRLTRNVRNLIRETFKRSFYKKSTTTVKILECSLDEFKNYIESKFEPWMNFENYGKYNGEINYGWDLDHIVPMASVVTEEDVYKLNHYTNFQPLCGFTNRYIKKDKIGETYNFHPNINI